MRACQQCGLSIGATATFCAVCGARVDAPASTTPPVSTAPVSERRYRQQRRHRR